MRAFIKKVLLIGISVIVIPVFFTFLINRNQRESIYKDIEVEEYVPIILSMTVKKDYTQETIKALSVLIRTNSSIYREDSNFQAEIVEVLKQKRGDIEFQKEIEQLKLVAGETYPRVLKFQGNLCEVPYHKISAGNTRLGEEVYRNNQYQYLTGVESAMDIAAAEYLTEHLYTPDDLHKQISEEFPSIKVNRQELFSQIKVTEYDSAGYALVVQIQEECITGEEFRKCLNLESSNFVMEQTEEENIKITCRGVGHGVGMSLYGANQLAVLGYSYEQILKYYFPLLVIE